MGREMIIQIVPRLPDYTTFYFCRMGSFSLSTNAVKYIAHEDAIDYANKIETSGTHYRDFLTAFDVRFPKRNAPNLNISYPYFAHAGNIPSAIYLDLRRAYRQIALSFGMEIWFNEGKSIGYSDKIPNIQLFEVDKISRGLLVTGHYKQSHYTEWKDGQLKTIGFNNPNYAPYLQYSIWRTLHAIMSKLKPYVYYAHTDGVIANVRMLPRLEKILDRYHFTYAIKDAGQATIKSAGCYKIGDRETLNFKRNGILSSDYILSDDKDDWWLKMFAHGVELRGKLPPDK